MCGSFSVGTIQTVNLKTPDQLKILTENETDFKRDQKGNNFRDQSFFFFTYKLLKNSNLLKILLSFPFFLVLKEHLQRSSVVFFSSD